MSLTFTYELTPTALHLSLSNNRPYTIPRLKEGCSGARLIVIRKCLLVLKHEQMQRICFLKKVDAHQLFGAPVSKAYTCGWLPTVCTRVDFPPAVSCLAEAVQGG